MGDGPVSRALRAYVPANGRTPSNWEPILPLALNRLLRLLLCGTFAALLLLPGMALGEDAGSPSETKGEPPEREARRSKLHRLPRSPSTASASQASKSPIAPRPPRLRSATRAARRSRTFSTSPMRREPLDPKRPITFVFNGGPGAASAYLHLGAIARGLPRAQRAKCSAPSQLVTNDSSWLDFTDLVFVDPVGTG